MSVECFGNVEVDTRVSKMPQEMQEVINLLYLFQNFDLPLRPITNWRRLTMSLMT